jgi:hypothetical protein
MALALGPAFFITGCWMDVSWQVRNRPEMVRRFMLKNISINRACLEGKRKEKKADA